MIPLHSLALTGLLIKLSLYLNAFLDQNPSLLEGLRLRAAVPYDASTIQVTYEHTCFCHILSNWKAVEFCLHRSCKHCLPQVTGNSISSELVSKRYAQPKLVTKPGRDMWVKIQEYTDAAILLQGWSRVCTSVSMQLCILWHIIITKNGIVSLI